MDEWFAYSSLSVHGHSCGSFNEVLPSAHVIDEHR